MEFLDIYKEGKAYRDRVTALYEEAFPQEEKKPFSLMEELYAQRKMELLAIVEKEEFIGLAINMMTEDAALLDYFAIAPEKRDGGYGSRAVRFLTERFSGKPYIFEVERLDDTAANASDRRRRIAFYLRNGLKETGVAANIYGTDFVLLTPEGRLTYEEYIDFLREILGEEMLEYLKPRRL